MVDGKMGVSISMCSNCEKYIKGVDIMSQFTWEGFGAIAYDQDSGEILLVEEQVMRIIQMVNPAQPTRKIKLISQDELFKKSVSV